MDYKNGKIYVIRNKVNDLVYVGSTTQPLSKRMTDHRMKARYKTTPIYQAMRDLGSENFYIELYEEFSCENKEQLNKKEGEIIRLLNTYKTGYNNAIAGRSIKEYYNDNATELRQKRIERYNTEDKKELATKARDWRKNNKEHYDQKIKERLQDKTNCECGGKYSKIHKQRHFRTTKHQKFISNLNKC